MTGKTSIEWTWMPGYVGAVWNPSVGCTRVSEGCTNCYAFALHDKRYASNREVALASGVGPIGPLRSAAATARDLGRVALPWPKQYDLPFSRVQLLPERLDAPLRTRRATCYFVDSMADLFHEDVPDEYIDRCFAVMALTPRHRFLVLTKRPERMRRHFTERRMSEEIEEWSLALLIKHGPEPSEMAALKAFAEDRTGAPPPNVWLGTSVEDQASADERIPHLLATPAAVRFLSCEPLLGPVDLSRFVYYGAFCPRCNRELEVPAGVGVGAIECKACGDHAALLMPKVHWLIVGGESGPRARPMDLDWLTSLIESSRTAGVAVFVKQDNGFRPGTQGRIPDALWLKEFPSGQ